MYVLIMVAIDAHALQGSEWNASNLSELKELG